MSVEKDAHHVVREESIGHHLGEEDEEVNIRRLLFKLDIIIVPLTAMLYLSAFLDRGNAGNAKLQGMLDIVGSNPDQKFAVILTAFYITYIIFQVPGNILGAVMRPNHALALGALTWSIASAAQAGAHNYASLIVCRLFIGLGEAAFGAAVPLYYGLWYRRDEATKRVSLYVGAGSLSGAFGGLIAYGVSFVHSKIATWRILFLIEGLPSILLGIIIFFCLPSTPEHSNYLTEAERRTVIRRQREPGVSAVHTFDRSAFGAVFRTHTTYLNGIIYMGLNLSLGSVSGFLPTIVKSFGYTNARAQLFTVPPYAVAFVCVLLVSYLSDRMRSRGVFVIIMMTLSAIGFAILIGVEHNYHARYFATFLVVAGAFTNIPLMLAWAGNTAGSHSAVAVRMGFMSSMGQCFSILASFIFPGSEGPHWYKGFGLNLAFNALAAATALYLTCYYRYQNRKRDREEGISDENRDVIEDGKGAVVDGEDEEPPANLHHMAPGFRFYV